MQGLRGSVQPTDQRQTLQRSRLYLVIIGETIGGKMDTAETGFGGDFELFTVAPLNKVDQLFRLVVIC